MRRALRPDRDVAARQLRFVEGRAARIVGHGTLQSKGRGSIGKSPAASNNRRWFERVRRSPYDGGEGAGHGGCIGGVAERGEIRRGGIDPGDRAAARFGRGTDARLHEPRRAGRDAHLRAKSPIGRASARNCGARARPRARRSTSSSCGSIATATRSCCWSIRKAWLATPAGEAAFTARCATARSSPSPSRWCRRTALPEELALRQIRARACRGCACSRAPARRSNWARGLP